MKLFLLRQPTWESKAIKIMPTTQLPPPMVSFADALKQMHSSDGTTGAAAPQREQKWKSEGGHLIWEDMNLFGALRVRMEYYLSEVFKDGVYTRAKVNLGHGRPDFVDLEFDLKQAAGVRVLRFQGPEMMDCTDSKRAPTLRVQIKWEKKGQNWVAKSRQKDKDNIDVCFLRPDGVFVQLQVSLSSRDGQYFWLTIQELNVGQVVRTTEDKAAEMGISRFLYNNNAKAALVIAASAANAFWSFNFIGGFKDTSAGLIPYALEIGYTSQLSTCIVAEWSPKEADMPPELAISGFVMATCLWFNVIYGFGVVEVKLEDGTFQEVGVYFKNIKDVNLMSLAEKGSFPAIQPASPVAIQYAHNPGRDRYEASVVIPL